MGGGEVGDGGGGGGWKWPRRDCKGQQGQHKHTPSV